MKKLVTLLAVACLSISIVGCGGDKKDKPKDTPKDNQGQNDKDAP